MARLPHWWLSFCHGDRPKGDQFVGACIVEGQDIAAAVGEAWRLGCNPGGQVLAVQLPWRTIPSLVGRLIGKEEATALTADDAEWPAEIPE
jgi:hypothetical protein